MFEPGLSVGLPEGWLRREARIVAPSRREERL